MTAGPAPRIEIWGGVECTVNRVGDQWHDQVVRSGHERRAEDLDRIAALGLAAVRYPVLWERLAPSRPDDIDWRWTDERLLRLRELGIRPIAGLLHHGSGPAYTSFQDPNFPEGLTRFAAAVAKRYPWVTDFTPVNEPLTTARFSALYGHWYPHARSNHAYVRALLQQLRATVLAMGAIRDVIPGARLIQTEDCGCTFGTAPVSAQVTHDAQRRWLTWDLLAGRVDDRHPLHGFLMRAGMTEDDERFFIDAGCRPDVLGLNYYLTSDRWLDHRLDRYPVESHGGNGHLRYADVEAVRARPEGIVGHEAHLLEAWDRYRQPVAVTEVHLGCSREEQMRWLLEAWEGAQRAAARGAVVRAVTAWALFGSYDWDSLVTRVPGHYEPGAFDVRGPAPRATALASVVSDLARGRTVRHPALAGTPWWRRPQKLAGTVSTLGGERVPLLIVGATGTLGRAFQRICEVRGLTCYLAGRQEVDITEPLMIDAIVRRTRPWAVINAAGYVRVDDAESDQEACRRANVAGAVNLAAACRRRELPFVTFSSDLVFDGRAGRPYVEDDPTEPLNVYGTSKAEAERRVLALLPNALIVRTSAFFGPWDEHNYLSAVFRALDRHGSFAAPSDTVISPTYVPDLVNACLDLLLDGESGIWHLANNGALSWFEFAQLAASISGRSPERIQATETSRVWGPAARPRFSALGSRCGQLLRPLDEAVAAYVHELRTSGRLTGTEAYTAP